MKTVHIFASCKTFLSIVAGGTIIATVIAVAAGEPTATSDPWKPMRPLLGKWEGDVKGEPGSGKADREYSFILNNRFIQVANRSTYPPQEKNPKGETHQDIGFVSYDKAAKKLMLRQFHTEGFVNQFALDNVAEDGRTVVFVSTAIENISPGWRARETYRIINDNEFIETFALAEPNKEFETYSKTHFRRKK